MNVEAGNEPTSERISSTEHRPSCGWRHFQHDADIGVCGWGETVARAFEQAGVGLTAVITAPEGVAANEEVEIECEAPDPELLFVDWLNSLIFEMATRSLLFARFEVRIDGARLHARAWGEPVQAARHQPVVEIKGATYTALAVRPVPGGWEACCVVDV